MGIYADILAAHQSFEVPGRFALYLQNLLNIGDPPITAFSGFEVADEVQTFAAVDDASDGTYTITVQVRFKDTGVVITFTTGNLDHDANAATIETAIDSASPATVPNGAISVSGGPLDTNPVVLTFDGNAVDETSHPLATITSALTDGMDPVGDASYTAARTTPGQTQRTSWAILKALGVIADAAPPPQGEIVAVTAGANLRHVKPWFIRAIAEEAAAEDSQRESYEAIMAVIDAPDNAPSVVE